MTSLAAAAKYFITTTTTTSFNPADLFTKTLPKPIWNFHRRRHLYKARGNIAVALATSPQGLAESAIQFLKRSIASRLHPTQPLKDLKLPLLSLELNLLLELPKEILLQGSLSLLSILEQVTQWSLLQRTLAPHTSPRPIAKQVPTLLSLLEKSVDLLLLITTKKK